MRPGPGTRTRAAARKTAAGFMENRHVSLLSSARSVAGAYVRSKPGPGQLRQACPSATALWYSFYPRQTFEEGGAMNVRRELSGLLVRRPAGRPLVLPRFLGPDGARHGQGDRVPHPLSLRRPPRRPGRRDEGHRDGRPLPGGLFQDDGPRTGLRNELQADVPPEGVQARPRGVARVRRAGRRHHARSGRRIRRQDGARGRAGRGRRATSSIAATSSRPPSGTGTTSRAWTSPARSSSSRSTSRATAPAASSTART